MLTKLGIKTKELKLFYNDQKSKLEIPLKYSSVKKTSTTGKTYYTSFTDVVTYNKYLNNNARVTANDKIGAYLLFAADPMAKTTMKSHFTINGFLKIIWNDAIVKVKNKKTGLIKQYSASNKEI